MSKKKDTFKSLLGGAISQKGLSPKEEKAKLENQIKQNIVVLQELKDLIPPLQTEEYEQLEKNILEDPKGIREPLKLWQTTVDNNNGNWVPSLNGKEQYVLIDGHNRFSIAKKHSIDFPIEVLSFNLLQDVKDWMIHFQLGRRNLTPEQSAYLRGILYNELKQKKGGNEKVIKGKSPKYQNDTLVEILESNTDNIDKKTPKYQNDTLVNTADKLADKYNVSEITIKRDGKFAEALNVIGQVNSQLKEDLLSGVVKAKKSDIQALIKSDVNTLSLLSVEDISKEAKRLQSQKSSDKLTIKWTKKMISEVLNTNWYINKIDTSRKGKHLHITNLNIQDKEWDIVQFVQTSKQSYLIGITIINSLKNIDTLNQPTNSVDLSLICVVDHLKDKLSKKILLNQNVILISSLKELTISSLEITEPILEEKAKLMECLLSKLV